MTDKALPEKPTYMAQERKCTTCMYWEQIYSCTGPVDSTIGSCNWSSIATVPMWLDFPEALLRPQTLGGAGRRCIAWVEHKHKRRAPLQENQDDFHTS
jgi:hypothetical protein